MVENRVRLNIKKDTKWVIWSRVNRRRTDYARTKRKRRNNNLQSATHITKDWATQNKLKTGGELWCSRSENTSYSI